jgi:hypothetical protein
LWREKAEKVVAACERNLWSGTPEAEQLLAWLRNERGLCDEIIRECHLGFMGHTEFVERESWGLEGPRETGA